MSVTRPDSTGAALKASLDAAREELRAAIARGAGGRGALERYADRVDALIRQLFTDAGPYDGPIAIIALGGYGRRHLCLHSDIDLLLLFGGGIGPAEERFVHRFLNPLWDLGVVVGHQVRDIEDFQRLETDNPEFLLALLDARPIAGARAVFERFGTVFHQAETHAFILRSLLGLIDERHAQFNATLYQLEPDVKEAPGALRDLTATRTIALLTDPLLLRRGPADAARFDDAEDFLLRVRSTLHLECGRNQNVLSHELQERTAEILGYPGAEPRQRVEKLMSDYFRHGRIVSRSLEWARRTAPAPVGANLGLSRDGVRFIDPVQAARNPASWLGAFQAALDAGTEVSEEALSCIQQHVDRYRADDFFAGAQDRGALLRFLKPRPGLYARLSQMHDCGLLGRVFPEFQAISWRVVRDFYHKYTVDEHTLLTIRNLERLVTTDIPDRMRFRSILSDLQEPELLVLALLFHDVGKWRDDDHAARERTDGRARARAPAGDRRTARDRSFSDSPPSADVDRRLSARHRGPRHRQAVRRARRHRGAAEDALPHDARRHRGGQSRNADAVEGGALVAAVCRHLQPPDATVRRRADRTERGRAHRTAGEPARRRERGGSHAASSKGCRSGTCTLFPRDTIYRHLRLARDIKPDEVHLSLEQKGSIWALAVATLDKPFLFSNICGVLSSFGMNILRGHAFTNPNGLVLDAFEFTDEERFFALNRDAQQQVMRVMQDVVSGRADVTARLGRREQGILQARSAQRFAPVVHADNKASGRYTISTSSPATPSACCTVSAA